MHKDENNKDFIDRKIEGFGKLFDKLFDAINKDLRNFIVVILIFAISYQQYKINDLQNEISTNKDVYYNKIVEEVKNQLRPEINSNIEEKTQKIETKVDSASYSLEELKQTIKQAIK